MDQEAMKRRTKEFAKSVMKLCHLLELHHRLIANQLFRSATSVGANYRAACRARSKAEFIAKLGTVLEEADESLYWLELIAETDAHDFVNKAELARLTREANELVAIFVSSLNTAKSHPILKPVGIRVSPQPANLKSEI